MDDGQIQLSCQFGRLIEAARPAAACMEGHRHDVVRVSEDRRAVLAHQVAQSDGERVTPFVFQEMDQLSQRPGIGTDRAGTRDRRACPAAAWAARAGDSAHSPGWQRIATAITQGRGEPWYRMPAVGADRTTRRLPQRHGTEGAGWRQQHRQKGIEDRADSPSRLPARPPPARRCPRGARARRSRGLSA